MERARGISRGGRGVSSSRRRGGSTPTPGHPISQAHSESNPVAATVSESSPGATSPASSFQRGRSRTFQPSTASRSELSPSGPTPSNKPPKPTQLSHSATFPATSAAMPPTATTATASAAAGVMDAAPEEPVSKGGHALRKRKVKSYSNFEADDDYDHILAEDKHASHAPSRPKKRKATQWTEDDPDEVVGLGNKKPSVAPRPQAEGTPSAAIRRRRPSRKATADTKAYEEETSDEIDVKDTIEVGVDYLPSSAESEDQVTFSQSESPISRSSDLLHRNSTQVSPVTAKEADQREIASQMAESPREITHSPSPKEEGSRSTPVTPLEGVGELGVGTVMTVMGDSASQGEAADTETPSIEPDAIKEDSYPADYAVEHSVAAVANISGGELGLPGNDELAKGSPEGGLGTSGVHLVAVLAQKDISSGKEPSANVIDEASASPSRIKQEPQSELAEEVVSDHNSKDSLIISAIGAHLPLNGEAGELEGSQKRQEVDSQEAESSEAELPATEPQETTLQPEESHRQASQGENPVLEPRPDFEELEPEGQEHQEQQPHEQAPQDSPAQTHQPHQPELEAEGQRAESPAAFPAPPQQQSEAPGRGRRRGRGTRARGRARNTLARTARDSSVASGRSAMDVSWRATSRSVEPSVGRGAQSPASSAVAEGRNDKPWENFTPYEEGYVYYPEAPHEVTAATPGGEIDDAVEDQPDAGVLEPEEHDDEYGAATGEGRGQRANADAAQDMMGGSADPTPALTPAGSPPGEDTAADSPLPDAVADDEIPAVALSSTQYRHRKLQDPQPLIAALKNHKNLSTEDLYALLEAVNETGQAWQREYQQHRRITDDDDNAVRRRKDDAAFETKTAAALKKNNPETDVVEKEFVVKGIRAREEILDASKDYQKQQDKLMSQVYLFEHDTKDSMVGKQDPEAQREGLQGTRLRNRPKPTQKAAEAEAEDNVVTGKRTRRKRALSEEASREPSRAPTPAAQPQPTRRGRRTVLKNVEAAQDDGDATFGPALTPPSNGIATKKQPARRARGARSLLSEAVTAVESDEEPTAERTVPTRKRNRGNAMGEQSQQAGAMPGHGAAGSTSEVLAPAPKRPRIMLINPNYANPSSQEIPSSSFYNSNRSPTEDSRPSTASSNATVETAASGYSLRRKRPWNYKEDDDAYSLSPKRQRTGGAGKKPTGSANRGRGSTANAASSWSNGHPLDIAPAPAPGPPGQVTLLPAPAGAALQQQPAKQPRSLKIKAYMPVAPVNPPPLAPAAPHSYPRSGSSSRVGTPTPLTQQSTENGDDEEKDYRQMTKSEKMSHSMKTRWANGSMAAAVAKRKATLAAKKAAAAQALASGVDPSTIDPSLLTTSSSKEATPVSSVAPGEQSAEPSAETT